MFAFFQSCSMYPSPQFFLYRDFKAKGFDHIPIVPGGHFAHSNIVQQNGPGFNGAGWQRLPKRKYYHQFELYLLEEIAKSGFDAPFAEYTWSENAMEQKLGPFVEGMIFTDRNPHGVRPRTQYLRSYDWRDFRVAETIKPYDSVFDEPLVAPPSGVS
jgi:hypothetical protein